MTDIDPVLQLLERDSAELAKDITAQVLNTVREYRHLQAQGAIQSLRGSISYLVAGICESVREGEGRLADEFYAVTRQRAREGIPIEAVLQVWDVTGDAVWRWLKTQDPMDDSLRVRIWDRYIAYSNEARQRTLQIYHQQRASLGDRDLVIANAALEALLSDDTGRDNTKVLTRYGITTERVHVLCCTYPESNDPDEFDESGARVLAQLGAAAQTAGGVRPPWTIREGRITMVVESHPDLSQHIRRAISGMAAPVNAGLSNPIPQAYPLGRAHRQAKIATNIAIDSGEALVEHSAVNLLQICAATSGLRADDLPPWTDRFLALDAAQDGAYSETVQTLYRCGSNPRHAANKLHIHTNTIYYRLNALGAQLSMEVSSPEVLSQIYLLTLLAQNDSFFENNSRRNERDI
ncbi:helix-turn-helix domain-containing protein [Nocardia xishanensis]